MTYPHMKLGSIHVRVRDLARSEAFYTTVLGMRVSERIGTWLFLSWGEGPHVLALEGVGLEQDRTAVDRHVGLFHVGWEVPDVWEFWRMHRSLRSAGLSFEALDEGTRWTLRFADPDGNGMEIYVDARDLPTGRPEWGGVTTPVDEAVILETIQGMVPGLIEVDARTEAD